MPSLIYQRENKKSKKNDFDRIVDLFLEYDKYENKLNAEVKLYNRKEVEKSERQHIADGTIYFLAEENREIIGVLSSSIDLRGKEKIGVLHTLIVAKNARKKGVGKALVEHVLNYFKSKGCRRARSFVHSANSNALNFWKNMGFEGELGYSISRSLK